MSNINKKKCKEPLLRLAEMNSGASYYNTDLRSMDTDFKSFCRSNKIDFKQANEIGINKSKDLLIRYFRDQNDGNISKEECENLYRLLKDPWDNSKLERHKLLASYINLLRLEKDMLFRKILILGAGTGGEYENLRKIYPMVKYIITDISENALKSYKLKYNGNNSYTTQVLDTFCIKSLSSFSNSHGKFDLIIASGVYRYAPSRQNKYNSAEFIYKNLLEHNGLFCIAEVSQDPEHDDPFILRRLTPILNKEVQTKMRINPTQFVFYEKGWNN